MIARLEYVNVDLDLKGQPVILVSNILAWIDNCAFNLCSSSKYTKCVK